MIYHAIESHKTMVCSSTQNVRMLTCSAFTLDYYIMSKPWCNGRGWQNDGPSLSIVLANVVCTVDLVIQFIPSLSV